MTKIRNFKPVLVIEYWNLIFCDASLGPGFFTFASSPADPREDGQAIQPAGKENLLRFFRSFAAESILRPIRQTRFYLSLLLSDRNREVAPTGPIN